MNDTSDTNNADGMVNTRCKLGDIAWISNALRKVNIGKVVTVKEYLGYFQKDAIIVLIGEHYSAFITGHYWVIENSSSSIETQYGRSTIAIQPDLWLVPITPPGVNAEAQKHNLISRTFKEVELI